MYRPLRINSRKAVPAAPKWPTYTGHAQFVGTSRSKVSVWVDPTLGAPGIQNANDLLTDADRIVAANNEFFGTLTKPVNVIVYAMEGQTDGTGGALHASCDYVTGQDIEVCASFGDSMRVSALFEAELSECSMNGNLCGMSTGEALSRWCAMDVSNNALADFETAPIWQQDGSPNFVDTTDPTDQNDDSIGCGMAFLSWLIGGLKVPITKVAPEMVALGNNGTLAELYQKLTGDPSTNAWSKFSTAIAAKGTLYGDDPFGGLAPPPVPAPTPVPTPTPVPGPETGYFHLNGVFHGTVTPAD